MGNKTNYKLEGARERQMDGWMDGYLRQVNFDRIVI